MYLRRRKPGEKTAYCKEPVPGWIVDFDKNDKPIEIELLIPSTCFPKQILKLLSPEFVPYAPIAQQDRVRVSEARDRRSSRRGGAKHKKSG